MPVKAGGDRSGDATRFHRPARFRPAVAASSVQSLPASADHDGAVRLWRTDDRERTHLPSSGSGAVGRGAMAFQKRSSRS